MIEYTPEQQAAAYAALKGRGLLRDYPQQVAQALEQAPRDEFLRAMIRLECQRQRVAAERRMRVPAVFRRSVTPFGGQRSPAPGLDFKSRAAGEREEREEPE